MDKQMKCNEVYKDITYVLDSTCIYTVVVKLNKLHIEAESAGYTNIHLRVRAEEDYDSLQGIVEIVGDRLETDFEYNHRIDWEKDRIKREQEEYERLKKKFEKGT